MNAAIGNELAAQRERTAASKAAADAEAPPHPLDVAVDRARTDPVHAAGLTRQERRQLSDWTLHRAATTEPKDAA